MKITALALLLAPIAAPAAAADISTHILDLAQGVGGKAVPVVLSKRSAAGSWEKIGTEVT